MVCCKGLRPIYSIYESLRKRCVCANAHTRVCYYLFPCFFPSVIKYSKKSRCVKISREKTHWHWLSLFALMSVPEIYSSEQEIVNYTSILHTDTHTLSLSLFISRYYGSLTITYAVSNLLKKDLMECCQCCVGTYDRSSIIYCNWLPNDGWHVMVNK